MRGPRRGGGEPEQTAGAKLVSAAESVGVLVQDDRLVERVDVVE